MFPSIWSETCLSQFPEAGCNISRPTSQQIINYPANTARNVARKLSTTKYILIADFEHLFNKGFESAVLKIAQNILTKGSKRVLVYRIFEVDEEAREPETKAELRNMMKEGKAVVFHGLFLKAHGIPGLEDWFAEKYTENGLSYENITYNRHNWEPQFVSRSDIPMHDVNFPFLARDNTVLRWELCRAGYQFDVLSDHFMYHKGIKRKPTKGLKGNIQTSLKGFQYENGQGVHDDSGQVSEGTMVIRNMEKYFCNE